MHNQFVIGVCEVNDEKYLAIVDTSKWSERVEIESFIEDGKIALSLIDNDEPTFLTADSYEDLMDTIGDCGYEGFNDEQLAQIKGFIDGITRQNDDGFTDEQIIQMHGFIVEMTN